MSSVSYLGYIFSTAGMAADHKKIQVINEWPAPKDAKDLHQFLGLVSYCRCYIRNFANIAAPFHQSTQKSTRFSWNQECEKAFSTLKQCLVQSPVLTFPDFSSTAKPFVLQTDASSFGIVAVLEKAGKVVAYMQAVY